MSETEPAKVRIVSDGTAARTSVTIDGKPIDVYRAEWTCDASDGGAELVLYVDLAEADLEATRVSFLPTQPTTAQPARDEKETT